MRGKRIHHRSLLFIVSAGFLLLCLACGKKGPPVPPKPTIPPAITDLQAEVIGDKVQLTWSVPKKDNAFFEGLEYFRVQKYMARSSVELCPGCPIPFQDLLEVKLKAPAPARVEGGRVIFQDAMEVDYRYAYKVVVYHESGGVSKDSNIVEFVTP